MTRPSLLEQAQQLVDKAVAAASHAMRINVTRTLGHNSPGALVFGRDMLLDVPFIADWEAVRENASYWSMKTFGAQTKSAVASTANRANKFWFDALASYASSTNALMDPFKLLRFMSMRMSPSTAPLTSLSAYTSNESSLTDSQTCKHNHWRRSLTEGESVVAT